MSGFKKPSTPRQSSSYNSLYVNPLNELKHNRNNSEGDLNRKTLGDQLCRHPNPTTVLVSENKENAVPNRRSNVCRNAKENVVPLGDKSNVLLDDGVSASSVESKKRLLKASSLRQCMKLNEPDSAFGLRFCESLGSDSLSQANMWDYSDNEAAPASSWSTIPNRSLLCRPLPVDIGRCTCVIVKEASSEGLDGGFLYTLYTNEGQGRQDRKLAVAYHKRRNGRSVFAVAQSPKGLSCISDDSFVGTITANFMGTKYHIWDQGSQLDSLYKRPKLLLAVVGFVPTVTTCTGSYRSLRAWIPKHQSMQLKNTTQIQHINGLPKDWEVKSNKTHQLFSRVPHYNNFSRRYELDFRERGRAGLRIQRSSKNFQLTMEESGRTTILQLGRVGKSKFVMDYRYPLTAYQAFSICLASIDSKLCCTV